MAQSDSEAVMLDRDDDLILPMDGSSEVDGCQAVFACLRLCRSRRVRQLRGSFCGNVRMGMETGHISYQ